MLKVIAIVTAMMATPVMAYDYADDEPKEIKKGDRIESYSYDTGRYTEIEVDSVKRRGGNTVIEVYDYETGTYTEMEIKGR